MSRGTNAGASLDRTVHRRRHRHAPVPTGHAHFYAQRGHFYHDDGAHHHDDSSHHLHDGAHDSSHDCGSHHDKPSSNHSDTDHATLDGGTIQPHDYGFDASPRPASFDCADASGTNHHVHKNPRPPSSTTSTTRAGLFVPTTTVSAAGHRRHRSSHRKVPAVSLATAMVTVRGASAATTVRCTGAVCRGDVRLWYRSIELGQASYHAQPGGSVTLALRLAPRGRVLLNGWAGKMVAATETASVMGGHTVSEQVKLQVRQEPS